MTPQQVKDYFGTFTAAAEFLGISRAATSRWNTRGQVPFHQQIILEKLTDGALVAVRNRSKWKRKK